ncbi:ATP-dependent Clp protease proteolytic subunit [Bradyrhizobium sp. JYMT SZCCT0428]|uniref:ATP-dependent Clp protease proteolytic subunit n=1 Tax=Bradyrhizobium sp. JYMT SZCCT0428 TaxID=2807673 RepID=UPI001BA8999A|nr:ATP-dependent Clp protease proteolytic subunit [Bradyrhizobium sp. JYMT SZCCT0428]MBR1151925.1 ATP-dependent Clp protease proteolytic subunit [Bradyrhizobium sp. JYMT SZCCT0428]
MICNVNCAGGDPDGALAIATALLQHRFAVHCRIVGRCSSSAALVAMAADRRSIAASGSVLLHRAMRLCTSEQWTNLKALPQLAHEEMNDRLNDIDDAQVALLVLRLGISEDAARSWLLEDRKLTPQEALERGFVHEIDGDS